MPTAIIRRKRSRYALARAQYLVPRRARAAYRIGRFIYDNRSNFKKAYRAAKWIRNKRRKRFSTRNVGEPIGTSNSKRCETGTNGTTPEPLRTRSLYNQGLVDIQRQAQFENNLDRRIRDVINLRGVRVCMEVQNTSDAPMYFNMAIISPKDGTSGIQQNDFFRSQKGGGDRSVDFNIQLTSGEFHCLPINNDKYTVLKHKRFRLAPKPIGLTAANYTQGQGLNYKNIDFYQPIKRQIRYQADSVTPQSGQVWMVWWCDNFLTPGGTSSQVNKGFFSYRTIAYFRETHAL